MRKVNNELCPQCEPRSCEIHCRVNPRYSSHPSAFGALFRHPSAHNLRDSKTDFMTGSRHV